MQPSYALLLSFLGFIASAAIGSLTTWIAIRKRLEEESLGRATRRTLSLQLLSDEEFTIEQVRDECAAMDAIVSVKSDDFGGYRGFLLTETRRINGEAIDLLKEVRPRRTIVEASIQAMSPVELEREIAKAYHGKRRAESQLARTRLSRTEVLKAYGVYDAKAPRVS